MNNRRRMMIKSAEIRHHMRLHKDIRFWFLTIRNATKTILLGLNNAGLWNLNSRWLMVKGKQ